MPQCKHNQLALSHLIDDTNIPTQPQYFPVVSFHGLIVREPNLGFSGHQMWNEKVMRDNNDL
jgi:hypothetical protein